MPARSLLIALTLTALCTPAAQAVLRRFEVRQLQVSQFDQLSPFPDFIKTPGEGTSVIDNDGGSGAPIVKRLQIVEGGGTTTSDLPGLSGFIWFNPRTVEGPAAAHTGAGDVTSTIDWGDVTGWTLTGGIWCHSVPSSICDLGVAIDNETVPAPLLSSHYDIEGWIFHGTGFTPTAAYVSRTAIMGLGNLVVFLRGTEAQNGTVPALPLIGVVTAGASIIAAGLAAMRRR